MCPCRTGKHRPAALLVATDSRSPAVAAASSPKPHRQKYVDVADIGTRDACVK
jgi:hypothetical protein